jgi:hypothetical protein
MHESAIARKQQVDGIFLAVVRKSSQVYAFFLQQLHQMVFIVSPLVVFRVSLHDHNESIGWLETTGLIMNYCGTRNRLCGPATCVSKR